jgi:hypothetical protein
MRDREQVRTRVIRILAVAAIAVAAAPHQAGLAGGLREDARVATT